jgi:dienelactone hydrolase
VQRMTGRHTACRRVRAHGSGDETEFTYINSLSATQQRAAGYVAAARGARPLLAVAHFAGGTRFTARELGYYEECRRRGWHCVCPQLHGEQMIDRGAFGSAESQHDILDAIGYMRSQYPVDPGRIYLAGRSMGGLTALLMAAKHPDLFAAVVAGQAITNLETWHAASEQYKLFIEQVACVPYTEQTAFEYARRSPVNYGPNFRYVPLSLWHGTNDPTVPPEETRSMRRVIAAHTGRRTPVRWLRGGVHDGCGPPVSWVCGQLEGHRNAWAGGRSGTGGSPRLLDLVTDEDKEFFWLGVERSSLGAFGRVLVSLTRGTLNVQEVDNVRRLTVFLDRLGKALQPREWRCGAQTAVALRVSADGLYSEQGLVPGGYGRIAIP